MLVLSHILIALAGLAVSAFNFFSPSKLKFKLTYALVGLTFVTGTYLVLHSHSGLPKACLSGLTYLGVIAILNALARRRIID